MTDRTAAIPRLVEPRLRLSHPSYLHYKYLFAALQQVARFAKGDLVDIGCGNKPYACFFPQTTSYVGCDVVQSSEHCVDVICDVTSIPLPDGGFDTALSTQVIEHVSEPRKMLAEIYRLLRPGGHLILSGPMYWPLHEEPYDFYRFTKHGLKHLLESTGFRVVEILPNGGKLALLGQVLIHSLKLPRLLKPPLHALINAGFGAVDGVFHSDKSTMNYVIVGLKP